MKKNSNQKNVTLSLLAMLFIMCGCLASVAGEYRVQHQIDKFNSNQTSARMTGCVIDADYLGIVANPAEFNPVVVRTSDNKILTTGILFSKVDGGATTWLNIVEGSTMTFLLNGGVEKITLRASRGDIDYFVSAPSRAIPRGVYETRFDSGIFPISPDQLKKLAYAKTIEVRVLGLSSFMDFPRKPNNHLMETFLPNLRRFYETEVQPYL